MNPFIVFAMLFFAVSCRHASKPSDALAAANMEALEQTVDMENGTVERDAVLKFRQAVVDLGTVPLGASREAAVEV